MQRVFVLDIDKRPLMPCRPSRAKRLLKDGKAAVFRRYPFTIILKAPTGKNLQPVAFKIDPGSGTTGIALVADFKNGKEVVWAAEISHRAQIVRKRMLQRKALRNARRIRNLRYRTPRFLNRKRSRKWLPPSMESVIANIETWQCRATRLAPVTSISLELVKFDTRKLRDPTIGGKQYQIGELSGGKSYRQHLFNKCDRSCAYCGRKPLWLEIEHIIPKKRGGSQRLDNLTLSCRPCNEKKGNKTAEEFGHPGVQEKANKVFKDASVMNAIRWKLFEILRSAALPMECGDGAKTKSNRVAMGLPKEHWIDAVCVGKSGANAQIGAIRPLLIRATGHGNRQRCRQNKHGFPLRHNGSGRFLGWKTGDFAEGMIPKGKHAGFIKGRVAIRQRAWFLVDGKANTSPKNFRRIHRADGYDYKFKNAYAKVSSFSSWE